MSDRLQWTPDRLLAYEESIAKLFEDGEIHAPIHLSGGNEKQLIDIFRDINPWDWVLCGWRSHYHCLLKGVPHGKLTGAILDGRSVGLCFPEHKILCSGIVGGIAPIAVGLAWAAKRKNDVNHLGIDERVHCFLGDMSAMAGIVTESMNYTRRHELPVRWIIEDNGISVCTDTQYSWGSHQLAGADFNRYNYKLSRPHSGIGKWVKF